MFRSPEVFSQGYDTSDAAECSTKTPKKHPTELAANSADSNLLLYGDAGNVPFFRGF